MNKIPSSVYRLQINEKFPLKNVLEILPYLDALGIEGIYCSPIFEAATLNGYDIVDPNQISSKIGGSEDFEILCRELKRRKFKLILDVVPNHMGIRGKKNLWWIDVLENGPTSEHAEFFDINWNPEKRELQNKVLLPILGSSYGECLVNQEIQLIWEDGFWILYNDYQLPVNPESYTTILTDNVGKEVHLDKNREDSWRRVQKIAKEMQAHPLNNKHLKNEIKTLYKNSLTVQKYIKEILTFFNGKKGEDSSFDALHELLERQFYRLGNWLVAGQEINYRRFFNINELIAIHIENEKVLQAHHSLVFKLLKSDKVQGLRIDHPDGLYDPVQYFERIRAHNPPFIVIEKILDINEMLPASWQVDGTVGYDFLNILNGIFIRQHHEKEFNKIYEKFIGYKIDFDRLLYERKKKFINEQMSAEINNLGWQMDQFAEANRYYRDFTRNDLTTALKEIIACFPVYRTYIRPGEKRSPRDTEYINQAVKKAKQNNPEISGMIYDYIHDFLLTELKHSTQDGIDFILRLQQQTAPVMAKGLEDSTFYIYNRLLALNEVGGSPQIFGIPQAEFHRFNHEKLSNWPLGFLATSTQDTKWSHDARMRLSVLSEIPEKWEQYTLLWQKQNGTLKSKIDGVHLPDLNTEYYLYQMLLAVWPLSSEEAKSIKFVERVWECLRKAMREAGIYTSWRLPDEIFESGVKEFLFSLLNSDKQNTFLSSFIPFQQEIADYGQLNSLSSFILKIGSCGIVEIYQGNENWIYSMMDPDNRHPVDFERLMEELKLEKKSKKLWAISRGLQFRRQHKDLFLFGEYIPLTVHKEKKEHVIAFMRRNENQIAIIACARFFTNLPKQPIGEDCWQDTHLEMPEGIEIENFRDIFTDKISTVKRIEDKNCLRLADCFNENTFSMLIGIL